MSNPFADTLHMRVRVSAAHRVFVLGLHGAAALVILYLAIARPWLIALLPVVAVAGYRSYRNALLERAGSIVRLRYPTDGPWRWQTRNGVWHRGRLTHAFSVGDWLVVLRLREDGDWFRERSCVLFADALDAQTHRRLRARLTIAPDPRRADPA